MAPTPQPANPPMPTYVVFIAEINPTTSESLLGVMADEVPKGIRDVQLLLSTPGGNVSNGIALYNALRAMPFDLTVHNIGSVDSIGNVIFLAGQNRFACANTTFMFHGVGFETPAQTRFQERQMRERLDSILADQKRMGDIIRDRTNLSDADVAQLFLQEQTKDVAYARTHGIIHDIRDVQIPTGATVKQLVFKR
jgi:ATP-dependent Clp protease protease subunit